MEDSLPCVYITLQMASNIFLFVLFIRCVVAVVHLSMNTHCYGLILVGGTECGAFGGVVMNTEEKGA